MTDVPSSARALTALACDTAAIVALLERFGALLTEALDAAARGRDEDLAVAVAERGRIITALGNRLAALALARHVAQREGVSDAEVAATLRPLDAALGNARLLHDRTAADEICTDVGTVYSSRLVLVR